MTPREIQNKLYDIGISQSSIANTCKVSCVAISRVIHGKSPSDKIRRAIARVLQKPVEEIWPDHLMPDGRPRRRGRPPKTEAKTKGQSA